MITIFTEHITDRLIYTLDFFFTEKGQKYELITAVEKWTDQTTQSINYSRLDLPCKLQVDPQGILFESDIYQSKKITYLDGNIEIDGVYDQFGLVFYLLSRYETYFSDKTDGHDRLLANQNTLVKFGLNKTVVVDRIVKEIWQSLACNYEPILNGYKFIPTFDIDVAWAYKNRKFVRSIGALAKGKKPLERFKVLTGLKKDPYDTYGEIRTVATKTNSVICFTLLGDWGKYDKNIHWKNLSYGSLIRGLNLEGDVGIHPSYASHLNQDKISEEIKRLQEITGHPITISRQHFLRLKIPQTYHKLINAGILNDYSMGFADQIGFRAGTSFPFYFFDLMTNKKTNLIIHPFAYMDSSLKDYLKISPKTAKQQIDGLIEEVKAVGGQFIFIWHNSSIHDTGEWQGWKAVLDHTIDKGFIE